MSKTIARRPTESANLRSTASPQSPRRQARQRPEIESSVEYALSRPLISLEPQQLSSESDDAFDYQELPAKILQLPKQRSKEPWVGDTLSPNDTKRVVRALTSVSLAFAKVADLSGDKLVALITLAMDAQKGRDVGDGIDRGTLAILEAIGFAW